LSLERLVHLFYVCCLGALLISPTIQNCFDIFPSKTLHGVEKKTAIPDLTVSSWFDGSFQNRFEAWYDQVHGLRDIATRTDNQINFLLFHQVSGQENLDLVLGKRNNLYVRPYINNYLKLDSQPVEKIRAVAEQIRDLQNGLAAKGIPFFFMISPSKATIYPEYIPDYMVCQKNEQALSNYQKLIPFLKEFGINYLDGMKFISDLKEQCNYPLFPRGGTHWNFFASYQMTLQIMQRIETLTQKKMHKLLLKKIEWDRTPRRSDDDLARLANLWDTSPFLDENPYPVVQKKSVKDAVLPNVLLAGASFANGPYWYLTKNRLISDLSDRYVYYHVKSIGDMDQDISERDIVILESTVQELPFLNRGFMPLVLSEFEKMRPPFSRDGKGILSLPVQTTVTVPASTDCLTVGVGLNIQVPCVNYNGKLYGFMLDFYRYPDDSAGYYWKLVVGTLTTGDGGDCLSIGSDLSMPMDCVSYNGTQYGFTLNFYNNPYDPSGYYWKMDKNTLVVK
jgi:hypothetical protein